MLKAVTVMLIKSVCKAVNELVRVTYKVSRLKDVEKRYILLNSQKSSG